MSLEIWAVAEAAAKKRQITAQSDAVGYTCGIMTWLLAGSVYAAVKLGINEMPPWTFCFWRALISGLILVPFVAGHYGDMIGLLRRRWAEAAFIGAIGLGLTQGVLFMALSYTSAVNVGTTFALAPMATMLFARAMLNEPMNGWQGAGLAIAFAGIVVISVHGSLAMLLGLKIGLGDLITLGAVVLPAAQTGRTRDRTRPMLQNRQKVLAKAPSTRDPKRTCRAIGTHNVRVLSRYVD